MKCSVVTSIRVESERLNSSKCKGEQSVVMIFNGDLPQLSGDISYSFNIFVAVRRLFLLKCKVKCCRVSYHAFFVLNDMCCRFPKFIISFRGFRYVMRANVHHVPKRKRPGSLPGWSNN